MHIDDAVLIVGAFQPWHLVQKHQLGNPNQQLSAPNQNISRSDDCLA